MYRFIDLKISGRELQQRIWNELPQEYVRNYKDSLRSKRTDEPKLKADIHCQLYNFKPMMEDDTTKIYRR